MLRSDVRHGFLMKNFVFPFALLSLILRTKGEAAEPSAYL